MAESDIHIDVSGIPLLNPSETDTFSKLLRVVKNKVSTETQLHEVAVHEAGHILQFALQDIAQTNLYGPTIRYRPEATDNPFFGFPAAVKETKEARQVKNDIDGVKLLTARCISGGVATHIIFNRQFEDLESEMADDYDQFEKMCDKAESTQQSRPFSIDRSHLWFGILKQVTRNYRSRPLIQSEILTVAEEVKKGIRAWRGTPIPVLCSVRPI